MMNDVNPKTPQLDVSLDILNILRVLIVGIGLSSSIITPMIAIMHHSEIILHWIIVLHIISAMLFIFHSNPIQVNNLTAAVIQENLEASTANSFLQRTLWKFLIFLIPLTISWYYSRESALKLFSKSFSLKLYIWHQLIIAVYSLTMIIFCDTKSNDTIRQNYSEKTVCQ